MAWSASDDNPFGVSEHLGLIEVRPAGDKQTVLTYYQVFDHPTPDAVAVPMAGFGEGIFQSVINQLGGEPRGGIDQAGETITMTQRRVVDASADRGWQVLAESWGEVDVWSSVVTHAKAAGEPGEGMTRTCTVPNTPGFRETMLRYDEDERVISYKAVEGMPPFVTETINTWQITPLEGNRSLIEMSLKLDVAPGHPRPDGRHGQAAVLAAPRPDHRRARPLSRDRHPPPPCHHVRVPLTPPREAHF